MPVTPVLPPCSGRDGRLLVRSTVAAGLALAVLAGAAAASPPGWGRQAAAAPRTAPVRAAGVPEATVRVDPQLCTAAPSRPDEKVVCRVDQVATVLIDHSAVVLSGTTHRGSLDLRGRTGLRVRGEAGAVLDAGGGRFALSLRDVTDVTVESLVLRGGTAQTVWVERTSQVALRNLTVEGSAGSGVQLRDSAQFSLSASRVQDHTSAGVMELTGVADSAYTGLVITRNGRGEARYNGDGLQLSGTRVRGHDLRVTDNGSDPLYEHGIYVSSAARSVALQGVVSSGNAGVALKVGGSGTLEGSALQDDRLALYCGATVAPGWTVRTTTLTAPRPVATAAGCQLRR